MSTSESLRAEASRCFRLAASATNPLVRRAFESSGREYEARADEIDERMGRPAHRKSGNDHLEPAGASGYDMNPRET